MLAHPRSPEKDGGKMRKGTKAEARKKKESPPKSEEEWEVVYSVTGTPCSLGPFIFASKGAAAAHITTTFVQGLPVAMPDGTIRYYSPCAFSFATISPRESKA
jgi:hypothetical protein